jgi:hypothetical protein
VRTYVKPVRPKRYLVQKTCDRCNFVKNAEEFPKVRGGGTADICKKCKSDAHSDTIVAKQAAERAYQEHREQEWIDRVTRSGGPKTDEPS